MKILFYDTKPYDEEAFDRALPDFPEIAIEYLKTDISPRTARLAAGYDADFTAFDKDIKILRAISRGR